jgi:uncharacterized DUF497 family protein
MAWVEVLWTDANRRHIAEHGIHVAEVEHVLRHPLQTTVSRTTGRPVAVGLTPAGRGVLVVYDWLDDVTVYPITAYDVE